MKTTDNLISYNDLRKHKISNALNFERLTGVCDDICEFVNAIRVEFGDCPHETPEFGAKIRTDLCYNLCACPDLQACIANTLRDMADKLELADIEAAKVELEERIKTNSLFSPAAEPKS
jgi:hypothetical protein